MSKLGYYSTLRGEIRFDPAASWTEIRAVAEKDRLFHFVVDSEEIETAEGTLIKRISHGICSVDDERVKAYSVESDLADLVAAVPDRSWSGEIRIEGEEAGDVQRLFVDANGHVTLWKARLLWPDGSSEAAR